MGLRRLAERLARGRRLRRRLPQRFGGRRLAVSPDVQLRWLTPGDKAFDLLLLDLADTFVGPGDIVWDVGASVGAFAIPAAHRSQAAVIAIEADPFSCGLMRETAALPENQDLDLRIVCVAAADRDGLIPFSIGGPTRASSGIAEGALPNEHGASREMFLSPCLRLDSLLDYLPAPRLLKVDTEGGERFTLEGAQKIITEVRPILFLEVYAEFGDYVETMLTDARYVMFSGRSPLRELRPLDRAKDWLAIPAERMEQVRADLAGR